jgi:hypothetical protein
MHDKPFIDINEAFEDGSLIDEAMNEALQAAVRLHQQANVDLVVWQDGKVVLVDAKSSNKTHSLPVDEARQP